MGMCRNEIADMKYIKKINSRIFMLSLAIICLLLVAVMIALVFHISDISGTHDAELFMSASDQVSLDISGYLRHEQQDLHALGRTLVKNPQNSRALISEYAADHKCADVTLTYASGDFISSSGAETPDAPSFSADSTFTFVPDASSGLDAGAYFLRDSLTFSDGEIGSLCAKYSFAEAAIALPPALQQQQQTDAFIYLLAPNGRGIELLEDRSAAFASLGEFSEESDDGPFHLLSSLLSSQESGSCTLTIGHEQYFAVVSPVRDFPLSVLTVTPTRIIYADSRQFQFLITLGDVTFILFVFLLIVLLYHASRRNGGHLWKLAYIDSVTGLPNAVKLKMDMASLFSAHPSQQYAAIYTDVKQFKYINSVYGVESGDRVLKYMGRCLAANKKCVLCGRISGNAFLSIWEYTHVPSLLKDYRQTHIVMSDISRIIPAAGDLMLYSGACLTTGREGVGSVDAIIDRSIIAYRENRENSLADCLVYTKEMFRNMQTEQELEGRKNYALNHGEFVVYLQPKYFLEQERFSAAEALVRWRHPEKGLIPPGQFIPLFEHDGFIKQIDLYVFECICWMLRRWLDDGYQVMPISVNFSKMQAYQHASPENYVLLKEQYNIPDGLLEIEFTERVMFEDIQKAKNIIEYFQQHGILCSIDDFGTGYSSLAILKDLSMDILKLDKQFFRHNCDVTRAKFIVKEVITLAHNLGMKVVAEGVESEEQIAFLRDLGCEWIQSFFYAQPMPLEDFASRYVITASSAEA